VSAADTTPRGPRRPAVLATVLLAAALVFAGLVALGLWQVQRLAWKTDLITRVEARRAAAPVPAPPPTAPITRADDEYRRVSAHGRFDHARATRVQASTALGSGYWLLTPLHTDAGFWLWVNRGFVPLGDVPLVQPPGDVTVAGLLRLDEPGGSLLQHNDAAANRWYSRDVTALGRARGLEGAVASYFIDAVASPETAGDAWPRPGLTVLQFSNNHRVYALTWFAMAGMVGAAIGWLLWDERRLRRSAGEPERAPRFPH
jgi:surfeit locus 1 family protein